MSSNEEGTNQPGHFVRLRGLPYSATEEQIRKFFEGLNVVEVSFTSSSNGRPSGECYCEFVTLQEAQEALKKDHQHIGSRYVEVFDVGDVEMEQVKRRKQIKDTTANKGFIRVRGLPYNCKREDIVAFFQGLTVVDCIFGKENAGGRPTGEGFVCFASSQEADRALQLNGQHLGQRYLEIFKTDGGAFEVFKERSQMNIVPLRSLAVAPLNDPYGYGAPLSVPARGGGYDAYGSGGYDDYDPYYGNGGGYGGMGGKMGMKSRPGRGGGNAYAGNRYNPYGNAYSQPQSQRGEYGYSRGGGGGYGASSGPPHGRGGMHASPTKVFIRGLPFRVTPKEIEDFFAPLVCVGVQLGFLEDGRASGDGIVEFSNPQEAKQALQKDRQNIGSRYVELFLSTSMKIPANTRYDLVGGKGKASNLYDNNDSFGNEWGAPPHHPTAHPLSMGGGGMDLNEPIGQHSYYGASSGNGGAPYETPGLPPVRGYGTGRDYSWPTTF